MNLPKEAKRLLNTELKNLNKIRKSIKHFFLGSVAGSALQVLRYKKELEDTLAYELILGKIFARQEGKKRLEAYASYIPDLTDKDSVLASLAASSFSNAWANAVISESPFNSEARLKRIVTTETARSFSDPLLEAADQFKLVRRWNAVLDSKTCKFCSSMDGDETLPGEAFKGDVEPGYVHINCRCISELILK